MIDLTPASRNNPGAERTLWTLVQVVLDCSCSLANAAACVAFSTFTRLLPEGTTLSFPTVRFLHWLHTNSALPDPRKMFVLTGLVVTHLSVVVFSDIVAMSIVTRCHCGS